MGVSTRQTQAYARPTGRGELQQLPTATGAAEHPMRLPRPWPAMWSIWLAPGTQEPTTPISASTERTRGHRHRQDHTQTHPGQRRAEESEAKAPPKHRVRRQRMPRMLIQVDGSYHPWLGNRVPPFTLLIAVDDATGEVINALFCEKEEAFTYFLLIRELVQSVGIPVALYVDRHGV